MVDQFHHVAVADPVAGEDLRPPVRGKSREGTPPHRRVPRLRCTRHRRDASSVCRHRRGCCNTHAKIRGFVDTSGPSVLGHVEIGDTMVELGPSFHRCERDNIEQNHQQRHLDVEPAIDSPPIRRCGGQNCRRLLWRAVVSPEQPSPDRPLAFEPTGAVSFTPPTGAAFVITGVPAVREPRTRMIEFPRTLVRITPSVHQRPFRIAGNGRLVQ